MSNSNGKIAEERKGCLPGFLQRLLGVHDKTSAMPWPYRVRDDFLSPAEASFFRVLKLVAQDKFTICPKVALKDIFFVVRPNENQGAFNKIARKHVDFLVCDTTSLKPVMAIELDDSSHRQEKRVERDRFVNEVFDRTDLPLLRVPARQSYTPESLNELINKKLSGRVGSLGPTILAAEQREVNAVAPQIQAKPASIPTCPKCSVPMVVRTAGRGATKGSQFYGCANYPKCREVVPITAT